MHRSRALWALGCALNILGCGAGVSGSSPEGPLPGDPARVQILAQSIDGDVRLDRSVVPQRYELQLTIDPNQDTFSGQVAIEVQLAAPTQLIRLHGRGLTYQSAAVIAGGRRRRARPIAGKHGGLGLLLAQPIPAGPARLELRWTAPLTEVPVGLYRAQDSPGGWYAFTQFEALDARRCFPSFDQPEFKTPFSVTLRVPPGLLALANGPEVRRHSEDDLEVFEFAPTQPLPTYLVAVAIGDFELVERAGTPPIRAGTPIRIVATKGKGHLAAFALERSGRLLERLSDYFGRPYPYQKLDQVAVPNFAHGAMENAGLVTYREVFLLVAPGAPAQIRLWSQMVIAHELAHQWYGDLVTLPWWDEIWLNESFATWMSSKIVDLVDPGLEAPLEAITQAQHVMRLDAKRDARPIRRPIRNGGDVKNAFDGITYGKGAAVLRMVEAWIGAEAFRQGVRRYIDEHAHGTGRTEDLLAALEASSGKPVAEMVGPFLDQPGTPFVQLTVACKDGGGETTTLRLTQRRYLPAGSETPQPERPWKVPVCVRYQLPDRPQADRTCFLLDQPTLEVRLPRPGCPAWLHPNADEQGYYRWQLPPAVLLDMITRHRGALTVAERVGLPGTLDALMRADALPVDTLLDALRELAGETHRKVLSGVAGVLWGLHHVAQLSPTRRAGLAIFVQALFRPHLDRLGLRPRPEEPVSDQLLRATLVPLLADLGRDPAIRQAAEQTTRAWLSDPASVSSETLSLLLPIASWQADRGRWVRLRDATAQATDPAVRRTLIGALAAFRDPALLPATLNLVLDGTLRAQDFRILYWSTPRALRPLAWGWVRDHYDALLEKLGQDVAGRMPLMARGLCSAAEAAGVASFFSAPERAPEGTAHNLGLALESIERCAHLREMTREPLGRYLDRLGP